MAKRSTVEKKLTLPEVKKSLESLGEENLDQFQRRTYDYVTRFSKIEPEDVEKVLPRLVNEFGLDEDEAVQVINCMPKSLEELRVFLSGGRKIVETSKLTTIIDLLNEHRKNK